MPKIALRPLRTSDESMVFSAWLGVAWDQWRRQTERCDRCGARFSYVGKDVFMDGMHARVTRLLQRCQSYAICPAPVEANSDYLIGFLVRERELPVLHFLYVIRGGTPTAARWRGIGVGTQAMRLAFPGWPEEPVTFTQDTPAMQAVKQKWNATYNFFLVE